MNDLINRITELQKKDNLTGIDFIQVDEDQKKLTVYFFPTPVDPSLILGAVLPGQISIRSTSPTLLDKIELNEDIYPNPTWENDHLVITTKNPGDFTLYRLKIESEQIDPYFNDVIFSFKVNCPSKLDCKQREHECPPDPHVDFPVDYMARDFWSFRRALFDFASLRYPDWKDRLEADAGVMLAEVMSALGDEMAYYQDRIGREAYLETASQRRSVRKHARLVDYHLHDGSGSSGWLDVTVKTGQADDIIAGTDAWVITDTGHRINFEVGKGLYDVYRNSNGEPEPTKYLVSSAINSFDVHIWDEDDTCLEVGKTTVFVKGKQADNLKNFVNEDPPGTFHGNKWIYLVTYPAGTSIPPRKHLVRLIEVKDMRDPVQNAEITRLTWAKEQALPFEMDMRYMKVRGNLIPVTAGKEYQRFFVTGCDPDQLGLSYDIYRNIQRAVERQGHDGSLAYLFSLEYSDEEALVWSGTEFPESFPEIQLKEVEFKNGIWNDMGPWNWKRSLLGINSSNPQGTDFTLDDGLWKQVVKYQRFTDGAYREVVHEDYASGKGVTIRFGDNEFGMTPPKGTIFRVAYRLGGGKQGNVSADTIVNIDYNQSVIEKVTNPFPVMNGVDPETLDNARMLAPEAFRAVTYRAVRPEDYAEAAERLDCVQKAGASFRWTGSWLTAFVTPDPSGAVTLSGVNRIKITDQLDRFRQAGREAYIMDPVYADLYLFITICVKPDSYQGEVRQQILEKLFGKKGPRPETGYFSPDHFTFGTSLDRSSLEAAIHSVEGVRAVEHMFIERRGWFKRRPFVEFYYDPGKESIIRVENDPLHPDRGIVKLKMKGGA